MIKTATLVCSRHGQLGHLNPTIFKAISNIAEGVQISKLTDDQEFCVACLEGKHHRTYNKEPKDNLKGKYRMTDLGPVCQFLGLEIIRNRQARTIHLHQSIYIKGVLKRF